MTPPLDHLVRRPQPYRTAKESMQPGYLRERFAVIRAEQEKEREIDAAIEKAQELYSEAEGYCGEPSPADFDRLFRKVVNKMQPQEKERK